MAEVTGPISTLPGAIHDFPDGTMCDEHPDRPAVVRIQGETDSFGCEMHDLCDECAMEMRAKMRKDTIGNCDWCDAKNVPLRNARDYEEGLSGRVYRICDPCKKRQQKHLDAECARYDDYWDDPPYDDYDDDPAKDAETP